MAAYSQKTGATGKALELMSQGRFKDAIAALDKAVEKNQDLFAVYKLRGSLKRMTGDFEGALADFSAAIEQKADDGEVYEQRAMMRVYTRREPAMILADLDAAISYGRKHEKVYSLRGMVRSMLRDFDGAISDYETAIGMRPDFAGAYLGLSGVYAMKRDEAKSAEVLENFIAMIENSDSKPEAVKGEVVATSGANQLPAISGKKDVFMEGSVIIKGTTATGATSSSDGSPNFDGNDSAFKLEQKKNTAAAYSSLAAIYHRRKDYEKASMLVEKGLALDPQDISGLQTRGKIRTDLGNYTAAVSDFDTAIKLMPNDPMAYLSRGIAKMLAGSGADAQKDFDKFLQLFPNGKPMLDSEIQKAKEKLEKQ